MGRITDDAIDAGWQAMTDEDLRQGLGMLLLAVTDPRCDLEMRDHLMDIGQDIRDELARRIGAAKTKAL